MSPSVSLSTAPKAEYQRRLDSRSQRLAGQKRKEERVANLRVLVFIVAVALGWLSFIGSISWIWMGVPVASFGLLVMAHIKIRRSIRRAERSVSFYQRGIDRVEDRWSGQGENGAKFADEAHPFAADLDLFGTGSLFQRINTSRTLGGELTLARWLKAPEIVPDSIRDRQAAVADLADRLDLREGLDLLGDDVRVGLDPERLTAWGELPAILPDPRIRFLATGLGVLALVGLVGWMWIGTGPSPFFVMVLCELGLWASIKGRLAQVLKPVEQRSSELSLLAELLGRLEREDFSAQPLQTLRKGLTTGSEPPSRQIARVSRLVRRIESSRNQFVAPFSALLMTGTRMAFAVEAWRLAIGSEIAGWLETVGTVEAFGSLGTYASENPDDPYPEILDDGLCFDAIALGHPLIPADRNVRNDLLLGDELRVLVVSGSNMSGKSTMLRTVGVNVVLAQLGAPVRAERLRLTPLLLGATLRVQDSLQSGTSRFYAELTRLREIVGLAGRSTPLLFLLDEIFHGTNSADRRVGAERLVKGLIEKGAIGLVTTHDLALAAIAEGLAPRAANVHFSDRFEDGSLVFDYAMHPGVVDHSNALALMRAVGLDI